MNFTVCKSLSEVQDFVPYAYISAAHRAEFPDGSCVLISPTIEFKDNIIGVDASLLRGASDPSITMIIQFGNIPPGNIALNTATRQLLKKSTTLVTLSRIDQDGLENPVKTIVAAVSPFSSPFRLLSKESMVDMVRLNVYGHPIQTGQIFHVKYDGVYQVEIVHTDKDKLNSRIDHSTVIKIVSPFPTSVRQLSVASERTGHTAHASATVT